MISSNTPYIDFEMIKSMKKTCRYKSPEADMYYLCVAMLPHVWHKAPSPFVPRIYITRYFGEATVPN